MWPVRGTPGALEAAGRSGGLDSAGHDGVMTVAEVAAAYALAPHPEGGFFRETFRSPFTVETVRGRRSLSTCILYLVGGGDPSRFHRLAFDEMWLFHEGEPLEMFFLEGSGQPPRRVVLGAAHPQVLVPAGVWMAARVASSVGWALVGCLVSPGFAFEDFERAKPEVLLREFPGAAEIIADLG
jgi:predicted cupin superfamily sugar epimerase